MNDFANYFCFARKQKANILNTDVDVHSAEDVSLDEIDSDIKPFHDESLDIVSIDEEDDI
ncbi:hypothetical protein CUJ83_12650 [Methanocella sp. CWC-04]|uniref:Uncharacterized protein n=1 Tax=Methanooceanicella nereidis TaxID=2052831 RepID=A0AAP2W5S0_9EURY|nr:hypothetical protein [Methanocella sp. CWC-04]MCD1295845.1 hypothetical protein [Methanocella sp. CWC-04]